MKYIAGYASVFNVYDLKYDMIMPGAFQKTLQKKWPKMILEHNINKPLGVWHKALEDPKGLWVEGEIFTDIPLSDKSLSIGFHNPKYFYKNHHRHIFELELAEISLVEHAANPLSEIRFIKDIWLWPLNAFKNIMEKINE